MSFIYYNYPNYKLDLLMRQLATAIPLWCVLYLPWAKTFVSGHYSTDPLLPTNTNSNTASNIFLPALISSGKIIIFVSTVMIVMRMSVMRVRVIEWLQSVIRTWYLILTHRRAATLASSLGVCNCSNLHYSDYRISSNNMHDLKLTHNKLWKHWCDHQNKDHRPSCAEILYTS